MVLSDILSTVAKMHPTRPALRMDGKSHTYADVYARADSLAGAMAASGVKPGDRVALLGPPCPDLFIAEFAAVALGAIPFGIFTGLALPEIQSIVEDADPTVLVYSPDMATTAGKLSAPSLKLLICSEAGGDHPSLEEYASGAVPLQHWHRASLDEPTLLIYTGGTTGRSKGVIHTHRTFCHWIGMMPKDGFGLESEDRRLAMNIAHCTGQHTVWSGIAIGGCTFFPGSRRLDANGILDLAEEEQLTGIGLTGMLLRDAVNLPGIERRNLSSLKIVAHGASATSAATLHRAVELFPQAIVLEGYAQTESGFVIGAMDVSACVKESTHLERLASVGTTAFLADKQIPMKIKIVDVDGHEVAPGEIGEVACQGPQMMIGYWRNPEATQAALQDGWLHTGDLGYLDDDGYLYLADRIKDMVIVGASNVYTSEVEWALVDHPAIAELSVLGTPLRDEGEAVTAAVVLRPDAFLSLAEIQQHCDGKIAPFKVPTRMVPVDALPRTPVNKIDKRELRRRLAEMW